MSSKRKLSELSTDEKTDAVTQLEKRLNTEFDRAHEPAATQLAKALVDAQAALDTLRACQAIGNQPHTNTLDQAEMQRIYKEFDEIYPPVETSQAFQRRHPDSYIYDNRSNKQKEKDKLFSERDAPILAAIEARNEALIVLNKRLKARFTAFNSAINFIHGLHFRYCQSNTNNAIQTQWFTEHK